MKTRQVNLFASCFISVVALLTVNNANAVPVLSTDNRMVSTSGFGQVEGYSGSWNQTSTPSTSYAPFNASLTGGVNFVSLPMPPHELGNFSLYTVAEQESTVAPILFTGSGIASMSTGNENSTVGASAEMQVNSLFNVGFNLSQQYNANLDAILSFSPVISGDHFNDGTYSGSTFISLLATDTMSSIFSYSFADDLYQNQMISDTALLAPGSYEFQVGVTHDISYEGFGDWESGRRFGPGFGSYNFEMMLTAVPEPSSIILFGFGLVSLGVLRKRKSFSKLPM